MATSSSAVYDRTCQLGNSAAWENKMYVLGGYTVIMSCTASSCNRTQSDRVISNSYLAILDFTQSFNYLEDTITKWIRMPNEVPQVKWATLWADKGSLYLSGGGYEIYPVETANGDEVTTPRTAIEGDIIWQYDISGDSWSAITAHDDTGIVPISRGQSAFDDKNSVVYILGGARDTGTYYLANGTILPASTDPVIQLDTLVNFGVDNTAWTNMTDIEVSLGSIQQGGMVHFESLGTSGALVVLGGWLNSATPRSMDTINLFDINTNKWYTQKATAEGGNFPTSRREFCAVSVSAVDGTSHNIYVYGGVNQDISGADSLSDVWILTLPYFHWIPVGKSDVGKESLVCNLFSERYMMVYGGRQGGTTNPFVECVSAPTNPMFDITSLDWTSEYVLPTGTPVYQVPQKLYDIIGGSTSGNATVTTPKNGFADDKLSVIFQAALKSSGSTSPTGSGGSGSTSTADTGTGDKGSSGTSTGAIAGGVVGGILVLAAIAGFFFWRMRKNRNKPESEELKPTGPGNVAELSNIETARYEMPAALPAEMDATTTIPRKPVFRKA